MFKAKYTFKTTKTNDRYSHVRVNNNIEISHGGVSVPKKKANKLNLDLNSIEEARNWANNIRQELP